MSKSCHPLSLIFAVKINYSAITLVVNNIRTTFFEQNRIRVSSKNWTEIKNLFHTSLLKGILTLYWNPCRLLRSLKNGFCYCECDVTFLPDVYVFVARVVEVGIVSCLCFMQFSLCKAVDRIFTAYVEYFAFFVISATCRCERRCGRSGIRWLWWRCNECAKQTSLLQSFSCSSIMFICARTFDTWVVFCICYECCFVFMCKLMKQDVKALGHNHLI